jgi:hypothetical protein
MLLADAGYLEAGKWVLLAVSSVAGGLPAEADEWDLSGLLVDSQPVSRATVVAWLNAAYQAVLGQVFEAQQPEVDPARSVEGMYKLLLFADAVCSTPPVLRACCAQLQHLKLRAQLRQQQLALDTDAFCYGFDPRTQRLARQPDISSTGSFVEADPAAVTADEQ